MPIKIAFAAPMRAGKDEAVSFLRTKLPGAKHLKFADPLYDGVLLLKAMYGFKDDEKERGLLQYIGTDWARTKDPDIWVKNFARRVEPLADSNLLLSDARFMNEFEHLQKTGWTLVKIDRSDLARLKSGATWGGKYTTKLASVWIHICAAFGVRHAPFLKHLAHASERDMDCFTDWDYIIENDGSLENYHIMLEIMLDDTKSTLGCCLQSPITIK